MDDLLFHIEMAHKNQIRKKNLDQAFEEFFQTHNEWGEKRPRVYEDMDVTPEEEEEYLKEHPEPGTEKNPFEASNGIKIHYSNPDKEMIHINMGIKLDNYRPPRAKLASGMEMLARELQELATQVRDKPDIEEETVEGPEGTEVEIKDPYDYMLENRQYFIGVKEQDIIGE